MAEIQQIKVKDQFLDSNAITAVVKMVERAVSGGAESVVIDVEKVHNIDAGALNICLRLGADLLDRGCSFKLINASRTLYATLHTLRVTNMLHVSRAKRS